LLNSVEKVYMHTFSGIIYLTYQMQVHQAIFTNSYKAK